MMICLFASGFAAFALVNALVVISVADRLSPTVLDRTPPARNGERLVGTKIPA